MGGRGSSANRNSFSFKAYGDEDYVTPFPGVLNTEEAKEIGRFNWRIGNYEGLPALDMSTVPEEKVELSKLLNSQGNIGKAKTDSLMKLSVAQLESIRNEDGAPFVIKYGDTYVIQDGHHRLSALKAKGAKTATVKLYDLKKRKGR